MTRRFSIIPCLVAAVALLAGVQPAEAAFKVVPLACETTSDTAGPLDLEGAAATYLSFGAAGLANGDTVAYQIRNGNQRGEGIGTYTTGTPNTFTRDASENSTSGLNTPLTLSGSSTICLGTAQDFFTGGVSVFDFLTLSLTNLNDVTTIDATTESTIESAIDTLPNLTSVQGLGLTLSDAGADRLWAWDDSANAYQNLSAADSRTVLGFVSDILPSSLGGTGNGFAKFSGPAASEKTFTLPNASATLKHAGRQTIWVPAPAITPNATNGCARGLDETPTNDVMVPSCKFDPTTQESAQFNVAFPKSWNEGTVSAVLVWSHPTTATNFGVEWDIACVSLSNDDAGDTAFGTAVEVGVDTGGTAEDIYMTNETGAVTCAGTPAEGDVTVFRVRRVPADAGDTLAVDARLHGVKIFYTDNAGSDD